MYPNANLAVECELTFSWHRLKSAYTSDTICSLAPGNDPEPGVPPQAINIHRREAAAQRMLLEHSTQHGRQLVRDTHRNARNGPEFWAPEVVSLILGLNFLYILMFPFLHYRCHNITLYSMLRSSVRMAFIPIPIESSTLEDAHDEAGERMFTIMG
jgi:hypothetical protein